MENLSKLLVQELINSPERLDVGAFSRKHQIQLPVVVAKIRELDDECPGVFKIYERPGSYDGIYVKMEEYGEADAKKLLEKLS